MLGLDATSRTTENLRRHPECVLNLVDAGLVAAVDRLALTSGSERLPPHKQQLGYRCVAAEGAGSTTRMSRPPSSKTTAQLAPWTSDRAIPSQLRAA